MTSNPDTSADAEIRIEAIVNFNKGHAYVLNRMPKFKYSEVEGGLLAVDGPFSSAFRYEEPQGKFKAFAGRAFNIPITDGGSIEANGQYWDCGVDGQVSCTISTVESLKKCYVFNGGNCDPKVLSDLVADYNARAKQAPEIFPYEAYRDHINAPDLRVKNWRMECKFKRAKKHILENLRGIKQERDALSAENERLRAALGKSDASLSERMESLGMVPLDQLLSEPPTKYSIHAGMDSLGAFREWVEKRRDSFLIHRMRYETGEFEKDDLFEWVFAHSAAFGDVCDQLRAALSQENDNDT